MALKDLHLKDYRDYQVPVLVVLVAAALFLEVYVHVYLGISVVYSHFFYVPIVLAAIWYGKRSVLVALLLGGALAAGTYYLTGAIDSGTLIRALMLVVIALIIGAIIDHMKKEQEQMFNKVTDAALSSGLRSGAAPGIEALQRVRTLSFASVKSRVHAATSPGSSGLCGTVTRQCSTRRWRHWGTAEIPRQSMP